MPPFHSIFVCLSEIYLWCKNQTEHPVKIFFLEQNIDLNYLKIISLEEINNLFHPDEVGIKVKFEFHVLVLQTKWV